MAAAPWSKGLISFSPWVILVSNPETNAQFSCLAVDSWTDELAPLAPWWKLLLQYAILTLPRERSHRPFKTSKLHEVSIRASKSSNKNTLLRAPILFKTVPPGDALHEADEILAASVFGDPTVSPLGSQLEIKDFKQSDTLRHIDLMHVTQKQSKPGGGKQNSDVGKHGLLTLWNTWPTWALSRKVTTKGSSCFQFACEDWNHLKPTSRLCPSDILCGPASSSRCWWGSLGQLTRALKPKSIPKSPVKER